MKLKCTAGDIIRAKKRSFTYVYSLKMVSRSRLFLFLEGGGGKGGTTHDVSLFRSLDLSVLAVECYRTSK